MKRSQFAASFDLKMFDRRHRGLVIRATIPRWAAMLLLASAHEGAMRRRVRPALAGMLIGGAWFATSPVSAQVQQLIDSCGKDASALSPSQRIDSCTALIQSGGVFGQGLSWAYENRCSAYAANGQADLAIADYSQAIQLDRTAHPYNSRGDAYLSKGDYEHAIADYDRVVELDKNNPRVFLKRGVANLYLGAVQKAAADLSRSSELDPHDPYTAIWLDILGKRSRGTGQLAKAATSIDMNKWPAPIVRLYLGQITAADANAAATNGDTATKKAQTCEANFYGGKFASQRGKKDEARRLFELAAAECPKSFLEYGAA